MEVNSEFLRQIVLYKRKKTVV